LFRTAFVNILKIFNIEKIKKAGRKAGSLEGRKEGGEGEREGFMNNPWITDQKTFSVKGVSKHFRLHGPYGSCHIYKILLCNAK
jgi:hypothetical protein